MKDEKTGDDLVSIGVVVDLDYKDATTSVHDLLQLFKLHPLVKGILEGGERVAWGAKALPGGGYWSMPKPSMPGALLVGDAGGMVDTIALKGVHHCIQSGIDAAEAIYAALKAGSNDLSAYDVAIDDGPVGQELYQVRNARQPMALKGFIKGAPISNLAVATKGKLPPGRLSWHRDDAAEMFIGDTADALSEAGRQVHVRQALERLHHRQRDARRRAEPHPASRRTSRGRSRRRGSGCARPACTRSPTTRPRRATST